MEKDTRNWIIALLIIFIVILVGAFLVKPATTGYAIYQEMSKSNLSMDDYDKGLTEAKKEISMLTANLSACRSYTETLLTDIKDISKRFAVCSEEIESLEKQKENIKEDYDEIIQKAADNICCKMKIDDSSIDSYSVKGSKIVCSSDGDKKINCNF